MGDTLIAAVSNMLSSARLHTRSISTELVCKYNDRMSPSIEQLLKHNVSITGQSEHNAFRILWFQGMSVANQTPFAKAFNLTKLKLTDRA